MIDLADPTVTNGHDMHGATNGAADSAVDRGTWLAARRKVIGASDIAALAGLNTYQTAYDVWASKVYGVDATENDAMRWGKRLEDDILDATEEYLGIGIRPNATLYTHPAVPYFGATPDGFASDGGVVEVKYTALAVDAPMRHHEAQCLWQMYVTGAPHGYLAYLAPNHQFHVFVIDRDDDFIDTLATIGHDFWNRHVLTGEAPAAHTPGDVMKMYPRHVEGKVVEADATDADICMELARVKEERKQLEKIEKQLQDQLIVKIGDGESLRFGETVLATYKATADGAQFDTKRFATEHPDLHTAYLVPKPGTRRFLLK